MFSSKAVRIIQFLTQIRNVSDGLILKSTKKVSKPKPVLGLTTKVRSKKKTRKPRIVVKKLSDDIEGIWLENLNSENLKLYRKTSFGSFRKIDTEKLLVRLKEIFPLKFGSEEISKKLAEEKFNPVIQSGQNDDDERASPYMSDFLIKHMVQFPLIKVNDENPLSKFIEEEKKDFGKIDSSMFPSVTGILSDSMSESARTRLKEWKAGMIEKMGKEGFNNYQSDPVNKYKNEGINKLVKSSRKQKSLIVDTLNQGTLFHSTLKRYLEIPDKKLVTIDAEIEGCWKSLENVLPEIDNVKMVEEAIYHPILAYRGVVDCVASYKGNSCVIEWKKSIKPKSSLSATYDAPLQLCAYLGALSWHKKMSELSIENGLVVVAYTDGSPANVFPMDLETCEIYWIQWLRRLQTYWLKKSPTIIQHEI